jgi:hypothetical protein
MGYTRICYIFLEKDDVFTVSFPGHLTMSSATGIGVKKWPEDYVNMQLVMINDLLFQ